MSALFLSAFVLGVAFCAPPGAITAEALRRGLARGFWPAFLLEIGSLIGDAVWAALALVGAAVLVQNELARLVLGVAGVFFLLRLAWSAARDARAGAMPTTRPGLARGDFAAGALLSLANPYAIAFWLGVGGAMVAAGVAEPEPVHFVIFFTGFMLAATLWCLVVSLLIAWGRRLITPTLFRGVNALCALALTLLAARLALLTLETARALIA